MKSRVFSGWYWEALCLTVYLGLVGSQLFVRPIVGMADNRDFAKVIRPLDVCDPDEDQHVWAYVAPLYVIDPNCNWDNDWFSSESIFVRIVKQFAAWSGRSSFRITGAGKAHLAVVIAALMILLQALHQASPALRFGLPPLVILIFSDVAYVSYLNSFYMDAAALVFLMITVALAAAWVLRPRAWIAIAFGAAAVLFSLSKTPHTIAGLFLALLAGWFSLGAPADGKAAARCWLCSAIAIAAAALLSIGLTPEGYRAEPLYTLIFTRIVPDSDDDPAVLAELGLPVSDLLYSGTNAYSQNSALASDSWRLDFVHRVTFARLAGFYLRNPDMVMHLILRGLTREIAGIRAEVGNYQPADGFPRGAVPRHFDWWTDARSRLLQLFPAHIVLFYAAMGTSSLLCFFRPVWAVRWPLYPLVLVPAAAGTVEFLLSNLLDAVEINRHLFLFHVITEMLILCAAAAMLTVWSSRGRTPR